MTIRHTERRHGTSSCAAASAIVRSLVLLGVLRHVEGRHARQQRA
jgi:hypothetical protein